MEHRRRYREMQDACHAWWQLPRDERETADSTEQVARFHASRLDLKGGAWYIAPDVPKGKWKCENNGSYQTQT